MKEDNCDSTDLNSKPKGNKNIDQTRIVFTTISEESLFYEMTVQIVLVGPNAIINQIAKV